MRSLCCIRTCSSASRNSRSSAIRSVGWLLLRFLRYMDKGVSGLPVSLLVGAETAMSCELTGADAGGWHDSPSSERWAVLDLRSLARSRSSSSVFVDDDATGSSSWTTGHASRAFLRIRFACDATAVSKLDDFEPRNARCTRIASSSPLARCSAGASSSMEWCPLACADGPGIVSPSTLRGLKRKGHVEFTVGAALDAASVSPS